VSALTDLVDRALARYCDLRRYLAGSAEEAETPRLPVELVLARLSLEPEDAQSLLLAEPGSAGARARSWIRDAIHRRLADRDELAELGRLVGTLRTTRSTVDVALPSVLALADDVIALCQTLIDQSGDAGGS
jgi:hypothetical protein